MEIKKSHKADLEHRRPWMFAAGFVITVLAFVVALNWHISVGNEEDDWEEDLFMDLDLKKKDEDLIAAAEKKKPKEEVIKNPEKLNKVEEVTEAPPDVFEPIITEQKEEDKNLEEEKENEPINENPDDPEVLRIVEELPQFPGGMVEYMKWLTKNLRYPPAALSRKIQGRVMVSFIVEKDGSVTNFKLEQRANTFLDNEALRVLSKMPNWTPGKENGKVCRSKVAVPVVFAI